MGILIMALLSIIVIAALLLLFGTLLCLGRIKQSFMCPHCGKHIKSLGTKCKYCGKSTKNMGYTYRSMLFGRMNCRSADNKEIVLGKTLLWVYLDIFIYLVSAVICMYILLNIQA